jgi:hypothetical protein
MFGNLLSVFHKHWPSKKTDACPPAPMDGNGGCTQSMDAAGPFYAAQTGVVSYEELLAESFVEQDLVGILQRAAAVLKTITVTAADGKTQIDGVQALSDFAERMLNGDDTLRTRSGADHTKTNLCVEGMGPDGQPTCTNGGTSRIIKPLTPLYVMLDALKGFDSTFALADNKDRLDPWHAGRSKLVDHLLTVERTGAAGAYDYKLADRNAYAIAVAALPWLSAQIDAHQADLAAWSDGLSGRLGKVLGHPLAAAVINLLDKFWDEPDASGQFTKVSAAVLNEADNPSGYRGMLVSTTDLLTLLHTDPELSPAIQFAALALAPNAFDAVQGKAAPDVVKGAATAGIQLARDVIKNQLSKKGSAQFTALAKLLRNVVLSDGTARSPAEILFDAVADVNRISTDAPTEQPLSADEDRQVFRNIQLFLRDDADEQHSLERLYQVIQARTLNGQTVK